MSEGGWFQELEDYDLESATRAIRDGHVEEPQDWPALAVATGFVESESAYYRLLHEATTETAAEEVRKREQAGDKQLAHAIRAMDDLAETINELAERGSEWAGSQFDESKTGLEYVLDVADRSPGSPVEATIIDFTRSIRDLERCREQLHTFIEDQAPLVAPNLTKLAGPVLAARLVSLAGGLETLAKKPSGTVQVLGAEDALFAHLEGHAPSPKHGIIFTHEYVRETRQEKRGSAARALAGKLSIAARVDHYRGELFPDLEAELDDRIETIRSGGADE